MTRRSCGGPTKGGVRVNASRYREVPACTYRDGGRSPWPRRALFSPVAVFPVRGRLFPRVRVLLDTLEPKTENCPTAVSPLHYPAVT